MTRDDCIRVMANLDVIKHVAEGGEVEFCLHDYSGAFVRWCGPQSKINLNCLGHYRNVKPRLRYNNGWKTP